MPTQHSIALCVQISQFFALYASFTFQEAILVDCGGGLTSHENAQATKSSITPKAGPTQHSFALYANITFVCTVCIHFPRSNSGCRLIVDCGGLISHENAQATKSSITPKAGWSALI
jgi:hypothetical protein